MKFYNRFLFFQLTDALKRIERLKTPAVAADCENCKKKVVQSRSAATQIPDSLTRVTGIQSGIIWVIFILYLFLSFYVKQLWDWNSFCFCFLHF